MTVRSFRERKKNLVSCILFNTVYYILFDTVDYILFVTVCCILQAIDESSSTREKNLARRKSEGELHSEKNENSMEMFEIKRKKLERDIDELTKALTISETKIKALEVERNNLLKLVEKALEQKTTQITWSRNTVTSSTLDSSVQAIDESSSTSVRISELETVNLLLRENLLLEKLSTMKNMFHSMESSYEIIKSSMESVLEEAAKRLEREKNIYSNIYPISVLSASAQKT